jgi:hypothetical protein
MSSWICSACLDTVIPTQEECIGSGESFMFSFSSKGSGAFQTGGPRACPLGFADLLQETTLTASFCALEFKKVVVLSGCYSYISHHLPTIS